MSPDVKVQVGSDLQVVVSSNERFRCYDIDPASLTGLLTLIDQCSDPAGDFSGAYSDDPWEGR